MALSAEIRPHSNEDGSHSSLLREGIAQTSASPQLQQSRDVELDRDGRPDRVLGFSRLQSGSATLVEAPHLDRLTPLRSYVWFSDSYYQQASEWFSTALTLANSQNLTYDIPVWQTFDWLVAAILDLREKDIDLYHYHRAKKAAQVIPGRVTPQRREQIPSHIRARGVSYTLRMSSLRWGSGTPIEATNRLSAISLQAMPDAWWLATYEEQWYGPKFDPIVYAQYGEWYVEIARWDEPQWGGAAGSARPL